jgi:hypothetical protein
MTLNVNGLLTRLMELTSEARIDRYRDLCPLTF